MDEKKHLNLDDEDNLLPRAGGSVLERVIVYMDDIKNCCSEKDIDTMALKQLSMKYSSSDKKSEVIIDSEDKTVELEIIKQTIRNTLNAQQKERLLRGDIDIALSFVAPAIPENHPYKNLIESARVKANKNHIIPTLKQDFIRELRDIDNLKYILIEYFLTGGRIDLTSKFFDFAVALNEEQLKLIDQFNGKIGMYDCYHLHIMNIDECKYDVGVKFFNLIKIEPSFFKSSIPEQLAPFVKNYKFTPEIFKLVEENLLPDDSDEIISTLKNHNKLVEQSRAKNIETKEGEVTLSKVYERAKTIQLNTRLQSNDLISILENIIKITSTRS